MRRQCTGFVVIDDFVSGDFVLSVGPDYRVHAARRTYHRTELASGTHATVTDGVGRAGRRVTTRSAAMVQLQHSGRRTNGACKGEKRCSGGGVPANENPVPYLVNPTQCTGEPLEAELVNVESWEGETAPTVNANIGPFTGCESLKFPPTIAVGPRRVPGDDADGL